MMGIVDCQRGDALHPYLLKQQWRARGERRLCEAVGRVDRNKARRRVRDDRHRPAVYPSALQGRYVAWQAEKSMTATAVALGRRNYTCDDACVLR